MLVPLCSHMCCHRAPRTAWRLEPSQSIPPQRLGRAGGQLRGAKLSSAGAPHPVVRAQLGPPSAVADLVPGRGVNLPDAKAARAAALRRPHVIVDQNPAGGGRSDVVVRGIVVRRSCLLHRRTVGAGGAFNCRKYRAARGRRPSASLPDPRTPLHASFAKVRLGLIAKLS
jgi:hypothetical protein